MSLRKKKPPLPSDTTATVDSFPSETETLRGQAAAEVEEEEEVSLRVRRSGTLRQRGQPPQVPTTLLQFAQLPF